jgi:hypothetical protein
MSSSTQQSPVPARASVPSAAPEVFAPPGPVRRAFVLWVTAVIAGAFETLLAVGEMAADGSGSASEIVLGLTVRLTVFTAALLIAIRMRAGRRWARISLALGLGVFGTASMVVEPLRALVQGDSLGAFLTDASVLDLAFGASRAVHVAAVLTAVAMMFLPAANTYFRGSDASRKPKVA